MLDQEMERKLFFQTPGEAQADSTTMGTMAVRALLARLGLVSGRTKEWWHRVLVSYVSPALTLACQL